MTPKQLLDELSISVIVDNSYGEVIIVALEHLNELYEVHLSENAAYINRYDSWDHLFDLRDLPVYMTSEEKELYRFLFEYAIDYRNKAGILTVPSILINESNGISSNENPR